MQTSTSLSFFTAIFVTLGGALAEELIICCRHVRTELYIYRLAGLPGFARDSSSKIIYISAFYFYKIYFYLFSLNIMAFPRLDEILTPPKPQNLPLLNPTSKCSPSGLWGQFVQPVSFPRFICILHVHNNPIGPAV